ncbi:MAG: ATP-binding cassette domain-containing protein [Patescibacteria group bacterium]
MSLLSVDHLSKVFSGKNGDITAVDDVSFSADAGEIFGLLGPNGAGKTTTIRLIATILKPTSGTARVNGHDIFKEPEEVRRSIGMLTTDVGLYDRFTARENLRYFGELYGMQGEALEKRIEELLDLLEMQDFADRRAGKFSTGMKQKVAIARSVIHDPAVIFFDEPTSGLDVLAAQTVVRFMQRAQQMGKLVVLSTHEMHNAEKLCQRVAIIHRGKLVALDSVQAIEQRTGTSLLEEAFLKIVRSDTTQHGSQKPAFQPKRKSIFTAQGIRIREKIFTWWRVVILILALGYVIYQFTMRK